MKINKTTLECIGNPGKYWKRDETATQPMLETLETLDFEICDSEEQIKE